jgi:hypothetical protein
MPPIYFYWTLIISGKKPSAALAVPSYHAVSPVFAFHEIVNG